MTFLHNPTQWKSVLAKHGDCSGTKTHLSHPTVSTLKSCQNVFVGMHFSTSEYAALGRIIYFPDSHITSYYWQHGDCWNVKYLDYVCALVLLFEPVKKKQKKNLRTCTKQYFYISIIASPRNRLSSWLWQGRNLSSGDEWACQIRDGLIVSIDSRFNLIDWITSSDAWTDICSLVTTWSGMSLFVCLHFSLWTVITIDSVAEEQDSKNNNKKTC